MEAITLKDIHELLKDVPESVLERVFGYIEAILEEEGNENMLEHNMKYQLTEQQKRELDAMEDLTDEDFVPVEDVHKRIREKYSF